MNSKGKCLFLSNKAGESTPAGYCRECSPVKVHHQGDVQVMSVQHVSLVKHQPANAKHCCHLKLLHIQIMLMTAEWYYRIFVRQNKRTGWMNVKKHFQRGHAVDEDVDGEEVCKNALLKTAVQCRLRLHKSLNTCTWLLLIQSSTSMTIEGVAFRLCVYCCFRLWITDIQHPIDDRKPSHRSNNSNPIPGTLGSATSPSRSEILIWTHKSGHKLCTGVKKVPPRLFQPCSLFGTGSIGGWFVSLALPSQSEPSRFVFPLYL